MDSLLLMTPWFFRWPIAFHEIFLAFVALGALLTLGREAWRFLRPYQKVPHGIERIAYHFRAKNVVHIYGLYRELPTIETVGSFTLNKEERAEQAHLPIPPENDAHAIVVEEPDWTQARLHFKVKGLGYHELKAMRIAGSVQMRPGLNHLHTVRVLSANAVILCRERRQLILHFRSSESTTYQGCYHTMGGAYMPPGIKAKDDLDSLKNTLTREVDEEARIKLAFDKTPPLMVMEEVHTGFIQVAFLGINISAEQADKLPDNPRPIEGKPIKLSFDDLPDLLLRPNWAPTGKAAIIGWLALGAYGAGPYPRFAKFTAAKLCKYILSKTHVESETIVMKSVAGR